MKAIRKRVDHWNVSVQSQAIQRFLRKYACYDSVNHSLEVLCYVADGFARPEPCCRVVKKHRCATQACDSYLECHAGAQRRLFKNHGQKFSFERSAIAIRPRFDVRRQVEKFAHLRGTPFHSGQEIVCECERCCGCVHFYLAAATVIGCACVSVFCVFDRDFSNDFAVRASTASNFARNSTTSRRLIMKAGSSRKICSWVQFMISPLFSASTMKGAPSTDRSTPSIKPSPRTSRMKSSLPASFSIPARSSAPRSRIFASRLSSSTTVRNSSAAAQTSGPPPKVVPCIPGVNAAANFSFAIIAPRGNPPASGFATATPSGGGPIACYAKY